MSKRSFAGSRASLSDDHDRPSAMDSWDSLHSSFFAHRGHADLSALDSDSLVIPRPGGGGGTGSLRLPNYVSGDPSVDNSLEFNIEIVFKGSWSLSYAKQFVQAADYITTYISGDVQDVTLLGQSIDDIRITAQMTAIDGVGGILGQAGPTSFRGLASP